MRKSVFLHDLEKKYKDVDMDEVREKAEVAEGMYAEVAESFSNTQSLLVLLVGSTALAGTSWMLMDGDMPGEVSAFKLFLGFIAFEAAAWFAKGNAAQSVWNAMSNGDYKETSVFLRLEAVSYLVYVLELVIFYVASMLSSNLSGLTFGCFVLLRQTVLYSSYKSILGGSTIDRIALILTNIAVYVAFLALPYLLLS